MDFNLLGKSVQLVRKPEVSDAHWSIIRERLEAFIDLTNLGNGQLSSDHKTVFRLTDTLVIFAEVRFNSDLMTRSFMDVENRAFYWASAELVSEGFAAHRRIPCYYYHDAFHVQQWLRGDTGGKLAELIAREREATDRQIEVARAFDVDEQCLEFLIGYRNDDEAIRKRLATGVGIIGRLFGKPKYRDHFPIL